MIKTLRKATLALAAISALPAAAAGWQQFTNPDGTPWTAAQYTQLQTEWTGKTVSGDAGPNATISNIILSDPNGYLAAFIELDAKPTDSFTLGDTGINTIGGLHWTSVQEDMQGVTCGETVDGFYVATVNAHQQVMTENKKARSHGAGGYCKDGADFIINPSLMERTGMDDVGQDSAYVVISPDAETTQDNRARGLYIAGHASAGSYVSSPLENNYLYIDKYVRNVGFAMRTETKQSADEAHEVKFNLLGLDDPSAVRFTGPTVSFVYYKDQ